MLRRGVGLGLAALIVGAACHPEEEGWTPVLETAPPSYLERELVRTTEAVAAARAELESSPAEAEASLDAAQGQLEAIVGVFLPLYRASLEASNAYRHQSLGDRAEAERALERVDSLVSGISRRTGGTLEGELEQVSSLSARAKVALSAESREAGEHLRRLAEMLVDLVTRAGLIL